MPLVTERLKKQGIPFEILFHQPAFHARDEAHRLGIPLGDVAKTILIETRGGHALAVIPASRRLDMHRVHEALGDHDCRLATEDEIRIRFPAYPLGALPPLSSELGIPIYVDPEVAAHGNVVFATSQSESIKLSTEQVLSGTATEIVPLAARPWESELDAVAEAIEFRASEEADAAEERLADSV